MVSTVKELQRQAAHEAVDQLMSAMGSDLRWFIHRRLVSVLAGQIQTIADQKLEIEEVVAAATESEDWGAW